MAAGDIHIHIGNTHKTIQYGFEFAQKLHFVKKDIVHLIVSDLRLNMRVQYFRVTEFLAFKGIKGDFNNMICGNATGTQVLLKQGNSR